MPETTNPFDAVDCPIPGCGKPLHLVIEAARMLYQGDLDVTDPRQLPFDMSDMDGAEWKVECEVGHVVVLPTEYGRCDCDDPLGAGCPHDSVDYDQSDEVRQFRRRDLVRLQDLLDALRPPDGL
jgi:hypothetical protein